jgi:hypothetical protein
MTPIEQRRELVSDKTRFTNRLCNTLKQYYRQALEWFEHIDTVLFCDFIFRWSTLSSVKHAHPLERKSVAVMIRTSQTPIARSASACANLQGGGLYPEFPHIRGELISDAGFKGVDKAYHLGVDELPGRIDSVHIPRAGVIFRQHANQRSCT